MRHVFSTICRAFALTALLAAAAHAGPPVVTALDVRGLQIGKVNTLTFTGSDLLPNPHVLTTARLARQTVKEGAKTNQVAIEVELAPGTQPGFENYWLVTDRGVSVRGVLAVDPLEQKPFAEKVESLPVALHGTVAGSQVREVTFTGKAGQEITCEIEAQRLESKLRPALALYGPGNRLVKLGLPMQSLRGDTRVEVKLPADGEYRVQFHDLQYAAVAPSHFRLKIGQFSYADLAYPSTVQRGATTEVELIGRTSEIRKVRLSPLTPAGAVPAPWADPATASGPPAAVRLSDSPELVEERQGTAPMALPSLPAAVNGRLDKANEEDAYEISVEPESEIELEVAADTLGSPIDAELELKDAKGARLALNDDFAGPPVAADPRLSFKVPKDVTKVIAIVRDVNGRSGPDCIYRLLVKKKSEEKRAGFALTMVEDSTTMQPGRPSVFKVEALRAGYDGPIKLAFDRLPEGVHVTGDSIPALATGTLVSLSTEKAWAPQITSLKGEGKEGEAVAKFDGQLSVTQPWLANDVALVSAELPEFAFAAGWGDGVADKKFVLAGKLSLPVKCVRPPGHDGPVRLTVITSQARRFLNGAIDANTTLREEKATLIEDDKPAQAAYDAQKAAEAVVAGAQKALDANKDEKAAEALAKKLADAQAALEKAAAGAVAASAKAKNDVELPLLVPAELPEVPHQIALKAELLARNRTTVEAVVFTPVQQLVVLNPFAVSLTEPEPVKQVAKTGAMIELTGQIDRLEGATGDVTLILAGLPAGVSGTTTATVKNGEKAFKFPLKIAPEVKPGEYAGLKITGTGKPFGNLSVKTRELTATLKVLPPDPPAETSKP